MSSKTRQLPAKFPLAYHEPPASPEPLPIPDGVRALIAPHAQAAAIANDRIRDVLNGWFVGQGIDLDANDVGVDLGTLTFTVKPKEATP